MSAGVTSPLNWIPGFFFLLLRILPSSASKWMFVRIDWNYIDAKRESFTYRNGHLDTNSSSCFCFCGRKREKKPSDIQVRQCNVQIRRNQTSKNANQVAVEPELQILSLSEKEKLDTVVFLALENRSSRINLRQLDINNLSRAFHHAEQIRSRGHRLMSKH